MARRRRRTKSSNFALILGGLFIVAFLLFDGINLIETITNPGRDAKKIPEKIDPEELLQEKNNQIIKLNKEKEILKIEADFAKEVKSVAKQAKIDPKDFSKTIIHYKKLKKSINEINEANRLLKSKLTSLNRKLRNIEQEAEIREGRVTPCWFKKTLKKNRKYREKPLYIFNVRIFNNGAFVKDIPAPTEVYGRQKERLNFDRSVLNKQISFPEFRRAFIPLRKAGQNKVVRERSCVFFVRVWDATTNKRAFKKGHRDTVQDIFMSYQVRNDPWPH